MNGVDAKTWHKWALRSIENKAGTSVISRYTYSVNPITQRESVTTAGSAFGGTQANWNWQYDSLGQHTRRLVGWAEFAEQSPERGDFFMLVKNHQLVRADQPTNSASNRKYEYDTIGNRTKSASGTTSLPTANNWTSNALNQYTVARGITLPTTPAPAPYDLDGNMTAGLMPGSNGNIVGVQSPANATAIKWDAENRLVAFTMGASTYNYQYDYLSRLITRLTGTTVDSRYHYDGWNRIAEYELHQSSFILHNSFLWGLDLSGSMQGAGGVGGLLATRWVSSSNTDYFPTYDGNGNISEYLTTAGVEFAHYEYDPFGTLTRLTGSTSTRLQYRFSTKPRDNISGLYYYGYRWYDPLTGRWPSRDPIEEKGGKNMYGFVGNNPIGFIDMLGLDFEFTYQFIGDFETGFTVGASTLTKNYRYVGVGNYSVEYDWGWQEQHEDMNFVTLTFGNINFRDKGVATSNTSQDMLAGSNTGGSGSFGALGAEFSWSAKVSRADTAIPANIDWKDEDLIGLKYRCVKFKFTAGVEIESTFTVAFEYSWNIASFGIIGAKGHGTRTSHSNGISKGRVKACAICVGKDDWIPMEPEGAIFNQ